MAGGGWQVGPFSVGASEAAAELCCSVACISHEDDPYYYYFFFVCSTSEKFSVGIRLAFHDCFSARKYSVKR